MKIRLLKITLEPAHSSPVDDSFRIFNVRVHADGYIFDSQHTLHMTDFKDVFGYLMRDAERRIRDMVADKITT